MEALIVIKKMILKNKCKKLAKKLLIIPVCNIDFNKVEMRIQKEFIINNFFVIKPSLWGKKIDKIEENSLLKYWYKKWYKRL